jgi:hypothetical protein
VHAEDGAEGQRRGVDEGERRRRVRGRAGVEVGVGGVAGEGEVDLDAELIDAFVAARVEVVALVEVGGQADRGVIGELVKLVKDAGLAAAEQDGADRVGFGEGEVQREGRVGVGLDEQRERGVELDDRGDGVRVAGAPTVALVGMDDQQAVLSGRGQGDIEGAAEALAGFTERQELRPGDGGGPQDADRRAVVWREIEGGGALGVVEEKFGVADRPPKDAVVDALLAVVQAQGGRGGVGEDRGGEQLGGEGWVGLDPQREEGVEDRAAQLGLIRVADGLAAVDAQPQVLVERDGVQDDRAGGADDGGRARGRGRDRRRRGAGR